MRLFVVICGICGIFSPKGRERIGREPKDGLNLDDCRSQGNSKEKQVINRKETGNGKPSKT
jgi:hypothetical protein